MAKLKAHEVDGFLSRSGTGYHIFLIYGPDRGMVSERASQIAKSSKIPLDDPFSVIKLDASTINADPARLADECLTVSMFGGDRLVWVKDAGNEKGLIEAVKAIAASKMEGVTLIIEADDLKPASGLRSTCENASTIMALPCYADDARGVDRLIDTELAKFGLTINLDARNALKNSLGGDRLASRGELEKLSLYCLGAKQVTLQDIDMAIGDVSASSLDELIDSVIGGDAVKLDEVFAKLTERGTNAQTILLMTTRQLSGLLEQRYGMDKEGKTAAAAVAAARPPVFFTRKALVERVLGGTTAETFLRYLEKVQAAVLDSRQNSSLSDAIAQRTLLAIAVEQGRTRNRR
jgi:DNA polymerase III subunit delta